MNHPTTSADAALPRPARRLWQFDLRTLLLLPLLVAVAQASTRDPVEMLLSWIVLGGAFGALAGIDWLTLEGGTAGKWQRLARLHWSSAQAGFWAGAIVVPLLSCAASLLPDRYSNWFLYPEIRGTAFLFCAMGAYVGAIGGLLLGPACAYAVLALPYFGGRLAELARRRREQLRLRRDRHAEWAIAWRVGIVLVVLSVTWAYVFSVYFATL